MTSVPSVRQRSSLSLCRALMLTRPCVSISCIFKLIHIKQALSLRQILVLHQINVTLLCRECETTDQSLQNNHDLRLKVHFWPWKQQLAEQSHLRVHFVAVLELLTLDHGLPQQIVLAQLLMFKFPFSLSLKIWDRKFLISRQRLNRKQQNEL